MLRFVGNGDQKKITKNPRHHSMQNSQANTKIISTFFLERRQSKKLPTWNACYTAQNLKIAQSGSERLERWSLRVSCTSATLFASGRPSLAPVQQVVGPRTPKHLLHPLLTALGEFEVSGPWTSGVNEASPGKE